MDEPQSNWSGLPTDLLANVVSKLSTIRDRECFLSVCTKWRVITREYQELFEVPKVPCLWFPSGSNCRNHRRQKVYNVAKNKSYEVRIPEAMNSVFRVLSSSSDGWVLYEDELLELQGYNTLTSRKLRIPSFNTCLRHHNATILQSEGVLGTANQVRSSFVGRAIVVHTMVALLVIVFHSCLPLLAVASHGDRCWNITKVYDEVHDLFWDYTRSRLCVVNNRGEISTLPIHRDLKIWGWSTTLFKWHLRDKDLNGSQIKYTPPIEGYHPYLVEIGGEMYQVWKSNEATKVDVRVVKLYDTRIAWVEMEGIGDDNVAFLGDNQPTIVSTKDFPELEGNCVHFSGQSHYNNDNKGSLSTKTSDMGVFNFKDRSFKPYFSAANDQTSHFCLPPCFIKMLHLML